MTTAVTAARTTAHSAAQLQRALGFTAGQWSRARAAGLIPPPDLKTPRWSGPVTDQLTAHRDQILAGLPDDLDSSQLMEELGLDWGNWRRGRDAGLIPPPDRGEYWTRATADALAGRAAELRATIPAQPLGARRCAELLAGLTGLPVEPCDIEDLAAAGLTTVVAYYKDWPVYDVAALGALARDEQQRSVLAAMITGRLAWTAGMVSPREAARHLGWDDTDLARVAAARGLRTDDSGRYARADITALTADEDLMEAVRRDQLLGPNQAAEHMEIRRRDFDYVTAAGWVRPVRHIAVSVGTIKTVTVPLYRTGDLEDTLREVPGVDWEAVRAVHAGEVSPLRAHTRLPARRAAVIRAFCQDLGGRWGVEIWPSFSNRDDCWEIDWELREDGHPTKAEVAAALSAHRGAARHAGCIVLSTAVGEVINWARACLRPGAAVVVDTETTDLDGVVIEIAAIDACTGETLLDTLVHPDGIPVSDGARAVHGISDAELQDAPRWAEVLPAFQAAVGSRRVLAYNASFDCGTIAATHRHAGLPPGALPPPGQWDCLMEARSTWARIGYWMPLGGGHRARGDALDARAVLQAIATPMR
jgi:Exonuclease